MEYQVEILIYPGKPQYNNQYLFRDLPFLYKASQIEVKSSGEILPPVAPAPEYEILPGSHFPSQLSPNL